jgi:hypothetical protein
MGIDMYEHRFREEIQKLPPFVLNEAIDQRVWKARLPAWRPLFSSLLEYGHSTGYRLFSFDDFLRYVEGAWTVAHRERESFIPWFRDDLREPMIRRIGIWYLSGLTEQQVYLALAEALEDNSTRNGLVFYDTRHDIKHKCDALVICRNQIFRLNVYWGEPRSRILTERLRNAVEQERKTNAGMSSHWLNQQTAEIQTIDFYARSARDLIDVNGVRLFSRPALNGLLAQIYDLAGVPTGFMFDEPLFQRAG